MPDTRRSADTSAEAEGVQVALLRAATPARRAQLALSLSATVIGLAKRAIHRANPTLPPAEQATKFVELHYGADLAAGVRASLEKRAHGARFGP